LLEIATEKQTSENLHPTAVCPHFFPSAYDHLSSVRHDPEENLQAAIQPSADHS